MDKLFSAIVCEDIDKPAKTTKVNYEIFNKRLDDPKLQSLQNFIGDQILVKIHYSTLNYKDALAVSAKKRIVERVPLILGVDLAGEVLEVRAHTKNPSLKVGDSIISGGSRLGEVYNGGLSQYTMIDFKHAIRLPDLQNPNIFKIAMTLGTAGLTAMLCVREIEKNCSRASLKTKYPVAVTGATGGVGLLSIHLLKVLGYKVVAISNLDNKKEQMLRKYQVDDVIDIRDYVTDKRSLKSQRFLGAIDAVGGDVLSELLKEIVYYGCVTSTGMVQSDIFTSTVYPFIVRGIKLVGVESIATPKVQKTKAWADLYRLVDFELIRDDIKEISLNEVPKYSNKLIANEISGRIVVRCN